MTNFSQDNKKLSIRKYCERIGSNSLFVQGAGGNISWKEGDVLWVKASGMWLIDATKENIFVPVDLKYIKQEVAKKQYSIDIQSIESSNLRPSIETILHAILPHNVVLHIHAVEILVYLVSKNYADVIDSIIEKKFECVYVDYKKPGADLAEAVSEAVTLCPGVQIIFLQNHGIVIGGADVSEINNILDNLIAAIGVYDDSKTDCHRIDNSALPVIGGYLPVPDIELHDLALNAEYYKHVRSHWALYPDHVVFLGKKPFYYDNEEEFLLSKEKPDLLFIKDIGVYVAPNFNLAKEAQLRCYYDVISRIKNNQDLSILSNECINELLDWDLEKYRIKNAK